MALFRASRLKRCHPAPNHGFCCFIEFVVHQADLTGMHFEGFLRRGFHPVVPKRLQVDDWLVLIVHGADDPNSGAGFMSNKLFDCFTLWRVCFHGLILARRQRWARELLLHWLGLAEATRLLSGGSRCLFM